MFAMACGIIGLMDLGFGGFRVWFTVYGATKYVWCFDFVAVTVLDDVCVKRKPMCSKFARKATRIQV